MKKLNKWKIDQEQFMSPWVVYHYIGGEDPFLVEKEFPIEQEDEAQELANQLNEAELGITWHMAEGDVTYTIHDPEGVLGAD